MLFRSLTTMYSDMIKSMLCSLKCVATTCLMSVVFKDTKHMFKLFKYSIYFLVLMGIIINIYNSVYVVSFLNKAYLICVVTVYSKIAKSYNIKESSIDDIKRNKRNCNSYLVYCNQISIVFLLTIVDEVLTFKHAEFNVLIFAFMNVILLIICRKIIYNSKWKRLQFIKGTYGEKI